MITLSLTPAEAAAARKHMNSAWIAHDEEARSFLRKLEEATPHTCGWCFRDNTTGTHAPSECVDHTGAKIKRG